ncbi:MAG: fructose-6-phosphate aldolase [Deltaproteobacteria bacterium]|nr:fructose-6-phosphate aldolase [Deltaproteobacteria bacterium]MCL5278024.1 fructose-6-phosphate aldolase [Deltaproteobacteria bacterium]
MKIFLDTANIQEIKRAVELGLIDGVTTNPSLLSKEGKEPVSQLREIVRLVKGPISAEVVSMDADGMVKEAVPLAKLGKNIVIKVPMCEQGLIAVRRLAGRGIRTNVTLVFSSSQALLAAKAGASYVSPFVGRIDDISGDGMEIVGEIAAIFNNYLFRTEIIVASIRHPLHFVQSAVIGAHIATVPFSVLEKLMKHPLTDRGIDAFSKDWEKLKRSLKK